MNKKVLKTISILILALAVLFTFASPVFATETTTETETGSGSYLDPYSIKPSDNSGAQSSISRIAGAILAMVQTVAIAVAVIMLLVLAIKYISAAPNDKAEIKKHAVVYIVGAVILFSASGILAIIKKFALNIKADEGSLTETTSES